MTYIDGKTPNIDDLLKLHSDVADLTHIYKLINCFLICYYLYIIASVNKSIF